MRGPVDAPLDDPTHLLELGHEVRLRVQSAGGVDDRDVVTACARRLDGVERDGCGVRAARRADEVRARPLRPDLELLLGRSAERVRRADEHRAPVLVKLAGELADRRRLPRAVDADDEDHARLGLERERRRLAEERLDLLDEGVLEIAGDPARLEPPHELGRRRDADVASDQRLLEPLPRLVVGRVERRPTRAAAVSARRLFASDSRIRPKKPERSGSSAAVGSSPRSSAQVLLTSRGYAAACSALLVLGSRRETTCETPSGPIVTP